MPVRTISIPVAEVLEGGTKSEFYADLKASLDIARRVANLAVTACVRLDDLSLDKMPVDKEKGMSTANQAYHASKIALPPGSQSLAASISNRVVGEYMSDRWQVRRGIRSVRVYKSFPWPLLHNAGKKTFHIEGRGEFLAARIKLASKWWTVRLAGGSAYRDQVAGLRKSLAAGNIGDSKVWVDRKHKAILGISCHVEAATERSLSGEMRVASCRERLLVATFDRSDAPFVINADICKQWQGEANQRYQRLRQDRKSDADRRRIRREMNGISAKMNRRMKTFCHEVAARVVNKAIRMKVATIQLDLTIKSYAESFPWSDLAGKIKYKAESAGIQVIDATQTVAEPDVEKPHVYFKLAPIASRIKIGMTGREDGGRHKDNTDSAEELVILAVDNQPKLKLRAKEKHYHAMFQDHRVVGEWFQSEPILAWLREARWLGNAGNLSQIMQALDVSQDTLLDGHLQANSECPPDAIAGGCSHNAESGEDIVSLNTTALAVTNRTRGS